MKTKADILNKLFTEQCTPLKNDSKLPSNQIYLTQSRLGSLNFNKDENYQSFKPTQGPWL